MLAVSSVLAENAAGPLQGGVSIPLASQSPKEAHMTEVEKLKEEVEALRRELYSARYDLTVAKEQIANIASTPGLYVIDVTGEYHQFKRQIEAYDYSEKLAGDGITSVVLHIIRKNDGVDTDVEGGTYTPPPRPSNDPQDVRNAA